MRFAVARTEGYFAFDADRARARPLALAPPLRAPDAFAFSSLPGQPKLGQSFQGPRAVVTTTRGAPQSGQTSSVAVSFPVAGSG